MGSFFHVAEGVWVPGDLKGRQREREGDKRERVRGSEGRRVWMKRKEERKEVETVWF